MNSRKNQGLGVFSPMRMGSGRKIVMKGWRQKVSNNLMRKNSLTTSYTSSSESLDSTSTSSSSSSNKITKKTRVSSTFNSIRLHAAIQSLNEKQEEEINFECEEDVSCAPSTIQHPTPFNSNKQARVNGHSYLSPSLNETQTFVSTVTKEESTRLSIHPEKESNEIMDEQDLSASQDHVSNNQYETMNNQDSTDTISMQDDEEEEHDKRVIQISDTFQLFTDNISRETLNSATPDYLRIHPNVKPHYRRMIIDWFNTLFSFLKLTDSKLSIEILYHATLIFDRALHRMNMEGFYNITTNNLQALGCACFFISSKYYGASVNLEDILPQSLSVEDTKKLVLYMESAVLNSLDFELRSILVIDYINLFIHALRNDQLFIQTFATLDECDNFVNCMEEVSHYICEIQLHNYDMLWFRPSLVALTSFVLAFQLLNARLKFQTISIVREFIKTYMNEMLRSEKILVDGQENSMTIEVEEFNNCLNRCLVSISHFEQDSLKNMMKTGDHFKTVSNYHATVSRLIAKPNQLNVLTLADLEHWN